MTKIRAKRSRCLQKTATGPSAQPHRSARAQVLALGCIGVLLALGWFGVRMAAHTGDCDLAPPRASDVAARELVAPLGAPLAVAESSPEDRAAGTPKAQSKVDAAPLVGRLLNRGGQPEPGLLVHWCPEPPGSGKPRPDEASPLASARSDAEGRFSLQIPPAMRGRIALAEDIAALESTPPARAVSEAGLDVGDLVVVRAAVVEGVTVDESGAPVAGVQIAVSRATPRERGQRTVTSDAQGRFRLGGLVPGSYTATTEASGFVSRRLAFDVRDEQRPNVLLLQLDAGHWSRGMLVDDLGQAIAGGSVAFVSGDPDGPSRRSPRIGPRVATDASGRFALSGIAGDQVTLVAWAWGHGPSVATKVEACTETTLHLPRCGFVCGSLRDDCGQPVARSRIVATPSLASAADENAWAALDLAWPPDERFSFTDEAGSFKFSAVPTGTWRLCAEGPGHLAAAGSSIEVEPGRETRVELQCARGAAVSALVLDPQGRPIRGVLVTVCRSAPLAVGTAAATGTHGAMHAAEKTNDVGQVSFQALPRETLMVAAQHDDWVAPAAAIVDPSTGPARVTLRLAGGGRIAVVARGRDGAPRAGCGCCAVADDGSNRVVWRGRTDSEGCTRSAALAPGSYRVSLLPKDPGFAAVDAEAVLREGTLVDVAPGATRDVVLVAPELTRLCGTVVGARGAEAGTEVRLVHLRGGGQSSFITQSRHSARTDPNGRYTIDGLLPGRYRVQFGRPGRPFRFEQEMELVAGESVRTLDCTMVTGEVHLTIEAAQERRRVAGARVQLTRKARPGEIATGSSYVHGDGAGTATATDVVPGCYELQVQAEGYVEWHGSLEVAPAGRVETSIQLKDLPRAAAGG